ncbi:NUDIX hydrolase [Aeromicrobium sp. CTD01-1L150]|uniref:NUDIX hydrolase n=1 Tax=Aeromicrobium sp. CTD01-1L150 TaxID=3341830 RepID=UPI0035BEC63A
MTRTELSDGLTERLPQWLVPLAELASSVRAEQLAPRFPHPPDDARPAAVLICFADGSQGPEVLLTERAPTLRNHAGQISFPGGASDVEDDDAVATALRETEEEVGLERASVDVFGVLPRLWLPPSNFGVTPVLGHWSTPRRLKPRSPDEVRTVIQQPLRLLTDPARRFTVVHPSGWRGPAFDIGTEMPLWGFTAGVLSRLLDRVGWAEPWDEDVVRDLPDLT